MKHVGLSYLFLSVLHLAWTTSLAQQTFNLEDSRHDLAIYLSTGYGGEADDAQCIFCHPPRSHTLRIGLWNEAQPENLFDYPYGRPAEEAPPGKPDGSSLVCLGCHDGTIALGDVLSRTQTISNGSGIKRTNLSDGHPISFLYDSILLGKNDELENPGKLTQKARLDTAKKIQCTTCHDPHDDTYGNFLVMDNSSAALCVTCHKKADWSTSLHNISTAIWNYRGLDPWPFTDLAGSVAEHGCANCHTPHTAGNGKYLLNYNIEEDNCMACHNGNVAWADINAEFNKVSHHPIEQTTGIHENGEAITVKSSDRHVECVDCHNPHSVRAVDENSTLGTLKDVRGVDINGGEKIRIDAEFELCFRCHGDGPEKNAMPTPRIHDQNNVRLQFDNGNPSFHPVVGPGNNSNVPSLIAPLIENSIITCSDCHSSDNDSSLGGEGPDGPHGSIYPSLLIRAYQTQDQTPESPSAYALCYMCHDRNSILGDESFEEHKLHVSDSSTPCSVCHDPHGISSVQGNTVNNSHLINFDRTVVLPNNDNDLHFEDRGNLSGACFLNCHNIEHDGLSY